MTVTLRPASRSASTDPETSRGVILSQPRSADGSRIPLMVAAASVLTVVLARLLYASDVGAVALSSQVIAVVSCVHGLGLFVVLGRDRVTMAGYFMAGSAVIIGLSGLLVIPDPYFMEGGDPERYLNAALFAGTLAQICVGTLCLRLDDPSPAEAVTLPDSAVLRAQITGFVTLGATVVLGERLGSFQDGFGFSSILLLCVSALLSRKGLRNPWNIAVIIGSLVAFPTLVISGTGRLRAIALVLAVMYVFFLRYGHRWLKIVGVLCAPVLLMVLGAWRKDYEEQVTGQVGNETGLSSMFVAIGNFGNLIDATGREFTPTLGASLLSPLRSAIPDGFIPAWIPDAIGYELAALTDPELYGTGFSTVASIYGDLWWNFGAFGLVLGVPGLAFMLERIDTWTLRSFRQISQGSRPLLVFLFLSALLGGVGDLVWAGFHTWIVRMYARTTAILVLFAITYYLPARVRPRFISFKHRAGRGADS